MTEPTCGLRKYFKATSRAAHHWTTHNSTDPDPVPRDLLRPPLVCCEVVHTPEETAFLRAARERGCDTHAGTHMLSAQLDAICEFLVARPEDWPDAWAFSSTSRVAEVS